MQVREGVLTSPRGSALKKEVTVYADFSNRPTNSHDIPTQEVSREICSSLSGPHITLAGPLHNESFLGFGASGASHARYAQPRPCAGGHHRRYKRNPY